MAESQIVLPLAATEHIMTGINPEIARDPEMQTRLEHLGITGVPRAVYEWRGYRYSNATDAIAAAERAVR